MDLSKLSDDELEQLASKTAPAQPQGKHDLSSMSDADLEALAAKTAPPEKPRDTSHDFIPFLKNAWQGAKDQVNEFSSKPLPSIAYDHFVQPAVDAFNHAKDAGEGNVMAGLAAGAKGTRDLADVGTATVAPEITPIQAYLHSRMMGNSNEDALKDARNIGALLVGPKAAGKAASALAEPAKDAALWAAKKGAKGFLGVNEESFDRRLANPAAVDNAPPVLDTTRELLEHTQENRARQSGESGDSYRLLADQPAEDPSMVLHPFQASIDKLEATGAIGAERKEAINYLNSVGSDIKADAEANGGQLSLDRGKSVVTLLNAKAKAMAKSGADAQVIQAYQGAAGKINDYMKSSVPQYAEDMAKLAADTRALKGVTDNFKSDQGAMNLLKRIQSGKAPFAEDALNAYDARNGTQFRDKLADAYANNDFTRATPNGSRRAVTFGATGTAIGSALGGSSGAIIGGALGTAAGSLADVYGGQAVKVAQDAGINLHRIATSPYAKEIMTAAQKGPQAAAVAHYTLSQRDPGYQQLHQSGDTSDN